MQAHVEGSAMLPMQIGFNTRAALDAIALAQRDIVGPLDFLEGPFGYFSLIDPDWDPAVFEQLGAVSQITRLSHKPFPSGRATHGGVDGAMTLQARLAFHADEVAELRVFAPPLVQQLVDRAPRPDMAPSYARLCLPYVVATALLTGTVSVEDFAPELLADPSRLELASRIKILPDGNPAPNALSPQRVEVTLKDGRQDAIDLVAVLGSPGKPLAAEQHLAKFRRAAHTGLRPLPLNDVESLIDCVDRLETLPDVREIFNFLEF
jgi:2-methylcitrate dehydratase PrpD